MNRKIIFLFSLVALLALVVANSPTVYADKDLQWNMSNIYYELDNYSNQPTGVLILEGYFTNNTSDYINYFDEFNVNVKINKSTHVKATFKHFPASIAPHSKSSEYRFRIASAVINYPINNHWTEYSAKWR